VVHYRRVSFVEALNAGILDKPQPGAAADPDHAPGASNHEEAQGPHAAKQERVCPFARATLRLGAGVELVVRQHAQLLPGTVGAAAQGLA